MTRGRKPIFHDNPGLRWTYLDVQQKCAVALWREIREGRLPRAKELNCVDCGKPAYGWDHRDYSRSLEVEPVCRSHNALRGTAEPFRSLLLGAAAE